MIDNKGLECLHFQPFFIYKLPYIFKVFSLNKRRWKNAPIATIIPFAHRFEVFENDNP